MVCKIFGLGHRKLIGKKLKDFFSRDTETYPAIKDRCMFGDDEQLKAVFGKAVQMNLLFVCSASQRYDH